MGQVTSRLKPLYKILASALLVVAALASDTSTPRAQDAETAEEMFRNHISGPIIQTRCVNCHVQGGVSGHTRLVFVRRSVEVDYGTLNLQTFEDFLAAVDDEGGGGTRILNKIQGVSHGGGVQVPLGSTDFANMQRFLGLLGEAVASAALTPETLFGTVVLASNRKTLRRAALIFAGRIPTEAEYAAVEDGDESVLRATIRGLMEGPEFHEFLIRGSNDRLLTDRSGEFIDSDGHFVDYTNEYFRRKKAAFAIGSESAWDDFYIWNDRVQHGARRAPLELIAHVVENDLPYTEILTGDYVMANPWAAAAYGASTQFDDPQDVFEFKPSTIAKYYRIGDEFEEQCDPQIIDACYVVDPGPLLTDYPHAGILNTLSFLYRYPTTATNRNRARARWTYYHFLGVDVEKSASRTTDPVALADANNPTMHNPACTVCHSVLDPVAGAFQNYGDEGLYRDQRGGMDSLDEFYKFEEGPTSTIRAATWEARETLTWLVPLAAGARTLRVMFTNPFYDETTDTQRFVYLDRISVTDADGEVIVSHEFEDLRPPTHPDGWTCGEALDNPATGRRDHIFLHWGEDGCAIFVDVEVPSDGIYDVQITAWAYPNWHEQFGDDGFAKLSVLANAYEQGDTWYNDMRTPGLATDTAPHPDNSLQWLAGKIVADERFAEATVKFWWPAIMGSEIAEPPEDQTDAEFEGSLLAANAQGVEVTRLANGFRDGFSGSPHTYNLKDLLVEIVLSKWFRADAVTDTDPVRRVALSGAGARRLLTPEELARKTDAITGVQWGRHVRTHCWPECERLPNALTDDYRLLYGGIDSGGVAERARDVTSVMAGVSKRHAAEVSCAVVMREIFLLPDAERRLFAGVDPYVTPVSEFSTLFEIEADVREERETLSMSGTIAAGSKSIRVSFTNGYWDEVTGRHRKARADRLVVRDAAAQVVESFEFEDLEPQGPCGNGPNYDHFFFHCSGTVQIPINIPVTGTYTIEVVAWAQPAGDELPRLRVGIESDTESSAGAATIKNKLVELHDKLLGVQATPDSPDVEAAYQLFIGVWQDKRRSDDTETYFRWLPCDWSLDINFLEGILDGVVVEIVNDNGWRWHGFDNDRVDAFMDGIDFSDPNYTAQAWVVVLAAMMMDYRYLYL